MDYVVLATYMWSFIGVVALLWTLSSSIVITKERNLTFISFLGKYQKTMRPGVGFKIPFLTAVDARVYTGRDSEKIQLQLKTSNQVMFSLAVNVQYEVSSDVEEAYKAVYNIDNYRREMANIAVNCAITVANQMNLDDLFSHKEKITDSIRDELKEFLKDFGVEVHRVLSDEPQLPEMIEERNNNIIAAKRDKEAAGDVAERIRIEKVGAAEADGESVKIRMEKLGEAREAFAQKTADAVGKLVQVGVDPDKALIFLNQIGEQDALVSASRNGSTIVFHSGQSVAGTGGTSADALLALALKDNQSKA